MFLFSKPGPDYSGGTPAISVDQQNMDMGYIKLGEYRTIKIQVINTGKVLTVLVIARLVLTGCANSKATEVKITLNEFDIESSMTDFQTGIPYRFVVTNRGAVEHEIMLMPPVTSDSMGMSMNMGEMDEMALAMIRASDLPSGATASFDYTFTGSAPAGNLELACHTPDHYEMGMKLPITVQ